MDSGLVGSIPSTVSLIHELNFAPISLSRLFVSISVTVPSVSAISILVIMLVNNYVANKLGLYSDKKLKSYLSLIWKILKCIIFDFVVLGCVIFIIKEKVYSRAFALYFASLLFVLLTCYRLVLYRYVNRKSFNRFGAKNILVVGNLERAQKVIEAVENQISWGINIVNPVTVCHTIPLSCENGTALSTECIRELPRILEEGEIDEVIFAVGGDVSVDLKDYINIARQMGIEARILPSLWDLGSDRVRVEQFQGIPFLALHVNNFNAAGLFYKRILDIFGGHLFNHGLGRQIGREGGTKQQNG